MAEQGVTIVEGGYCSDVSYLEKVKEKGQQHAKLEEALRLYGYNATSLTYILDLHKWRHWITV